jgi:integron integrase
MSEKDAIQRFVAFMRLKHWALTTERSYVAWAHKYTAFVKRGTCGRSSSEEKVRAYLESIAPHCAAKTQNQCLNALVVFYREGIGTPLGKLGAWSYAKRPQRIPEYVDVADAKRILALIPGTHGLMASLLFGSGLRLMECVRLRVKDCDVKNRALFIRGGKGNKDRVVNLPVSLVAPLTAHLERVKALWTGDQANGHPPIQLPTEGLDRKFPNGGKQWPWFWVFPGKGLSRDPRSGIYRRHHTHENGLQKAVTKAAQVAGIGKRVSCHTLRHGYITALVQAGEDISKVQALAGHKHIATTQIYIHIAPKAVASVKSPLD